MSKKKPEIPTNKLIERLRLMSEVGGMLTKDRIDAVRQAADRLETLDERVAIMSEGSFTGLHQVIFNTAKVEGGEDK